MLILLTTCLMKSTILKNKIMNIFNANTHIFFMYTHVYLFYFILKIITKNAFLVSTLKLIPNILEHQMNTCVYILITVVFSFVRIAEDHP